MTSRFRLLTWRSKQKKGEHELQINHASVRVIFRVIRFNSSRPGVTLADQAKLGFTGTVGSDRPPPINIENDDHAAMPATIMLRRPTHRPIRAYDLQVRLRQIQDKTRTFLKGLFEPPTFIVGIAAANSAV